MKYFECRPFFNDVFFQHENTLEQFPISIDLPVPRNIFQFFYTIPPELHIYYRGFGL